MPQDTPTFAITTPCVGEAITLASFQTYANDVEVALNTVSALADDALNPPAVSITNDASQAFAVGVTTTATFQVEFYDRENMWDVGSPTIITIPENGTYLANVVVQTTSAPFPYTSIRVAILSAGTEVAFHESQQQGALEPSRYLTISAFLPALTAGTQLTTQLLYTGTGNAFPNVGFNVVKLAIP